MIYKASINIEEESTNVKNNFYRSFNFHVKLIANIFTYINDSIPFMYGNIDGIMTESKR